MSFCVSILSTSVIISSFSVTYPDFYYSISTLLLPSQFPCCCYFVHLFLQWPSFRIIHLSSHRIDQPLLADSACVCVCERAPGWVFDCSLSCEDADEDSNVKVDADGQQGLDVSLVHSCPLVQTVQDDAQSLEFKDGEMETFFLLLWKSGKHLGSVYRDVRKLCWIRSFIRLQRGFVFIKSNRIYEVFFNDPCIYVPLLPLTAREGVNSTTVWKTTCAICSMKSDHESTWEGGKKKKRPSWEHHTCSGCGANTFTSCSFLVFLPKKIFNTNGVAYMMTLWMVAQVYCVIYCYPSGSHWDGCMFDLDDSISSSPLF